MTTSFPAPQKICLSSSTQPQLQHHADGKQGLQATKLASSTTPQPVFGWSSTPPRATPKPLQLLRPDQTIPSKAENETNQDTLQNKHTVFLVPTLPETGTISSLALLGSLANLHCNERSNTLPWNLRKNTAHEDRGNHPVPLNHRA